MKDIYALLGVSWQAVYKWRENPITTQTRSYIKYNFIKRAGELFSLDMDEMEALANKAGLSLCASDFNSEIDLKSIPTYDYFATECSDELSPDIEGINPYLVSQLKYTNTSFAIYFNALLATYTGKKNELCGAASVSDRMFRHIKAGRYLKKEVVLALLIVLGLSLNEIQTALKKAGFILSNSLPNDAVVIWMLNNDACNLCGAVRLRTINETLYSLDLPLLMTRLKI
jgi:hypothetical protein